jgi:hypothetical protein
MIRKIGDNTEVQEKRTSDDQGKLKSKLIDADTEKKLVAAGFTKKMLYNRRGGPGEKGLSTMLEKDDEIIEIKPGQVKIKTREGTIQTFYDLEAPQDFLKPVAGEKSPKG